MRTTTYGGRPARRERFFLESAVCRTDRASPSVTASRGPGPSDSFMPIDRALQAPARRRIVLPIGRLLGRTSRRDFRRCPIDHVHCADHRCQRALRQTCERSVPARSPLRITTPHTAAQGPRGRPALKDMCSVSSCERRWLTIRKAYRAPQRSTRAAVRGDAFVYGKGRPRPLYWCLRQQVRGR